MSAAPDKPITLGPPTSLPHLGAGDDIVDRLRKGAHGAERLLEEAAREIERLRRSERLARVDWS